MPIEEINKVNSVDIRRLTLRRKVFVLVLEKLTQAEINNILARDGISKQSVSKALKAMERAGWVIQSDQKYPKIWIPTLHGREEVNRASLRLSAARTLSRVEHFQIKFPLLHPERPDTVQWDSIKPDGFNRWFRKYVSLEWPHEIRIERTTKSIIFHVHQKHLPRDRTFFTALAQFTAKILIYGRLWLQNHNIEVGDEEVISQEIGNDAPEYDDKVDPKTKVTMSLGRQAESILGPMRTREDSPIAAKAWIDRSHGVVEMETNDLRYAEKLIMMPERIDDLFDMQAENTRILGGSMKVLQDYTQQMSLHMSAIQGLKKATEDLTSGVAEMRQTLRGTQPAPPIEPPKQVQPFVQQPVQRPVSRPASAADNDDVLDMIVDLHRKMNGPVYVSTLYTHVQKRFRRMTPKTIRHALVYLKNTGKIIFDTAKGHITPVGAAAARTEKRPERPAYDDSIYRWLQ